MNSANSPDPRDGEQARDNAFRDKLLGSECFCGVKFDDRRTVKLSDDVSLTVKTPPCRPLRCLAHGYCEAHLTPVAAQMTTDDIARLGRRCGLTGPWATP